MRTGLLRRRPLARGTSLSDEATEWLAVGLIAAASAALGIAQGGYSQETVAIATLIVWMMVAGGIIAGLGSRSQIGRPALVVGGCLAGLTVLSAVSMVWADDPGRSFAAAIRVAGYLGLFTLVVLAAPGTGRRAWIHGLAVGITVVCAVALGSRFVPSLLGGDDLQLGTAIPSAAGRLSYPIGYWNGLAALLAIDIVLLAWLGTCGRGRAGRALAVGLLPLPILGIYLASSRGGVAAAALGSAVLLILTQKRVAMLSGGLLGGAGGAVLVLFGRTQEEFVAGGTGATATHQGELMLLLAALCVGLIAAGRYLLDPWLQDVRPSGRHRLWPWAVALVIAVGLFIALASHEGANVGSDAPTGRGHLASAQASGRYQFWDGALSAYASEPAGGVGAGNFELYWNAHPKLAVPLVNAHSLYLETLAELGPAGVALLLGFLAVPVIVAVRRRSSRASPAVHEVALALLATGALSAAIEWTWQIPAAFAPVVVAAGLLIVANRSEEEADRRRRAGRATLATVVTLAIGWAAIWAAAVSFATDRELAGSRSAAAHGDLAKAADDARTAATIQPWSPEPVLQLALVEELGGDLEAAKATAFEAIRKAPGDWRSWAVAARIEVKLGDAPAAGFLATGARHLSPTQLPSEFSSLPGE